MSVKTSDFVYTRGQLPTLGDRVETDETDGEDYDTGKVVALLPSGMVTVYWDRAGCEYMEDPADLRLLERNAPDA